MTKFRLLLQHLNTGNSRNVKIKKNIASLFIIKSYSALLNLALIPLTLQMLDNYKYGIWITLFNVLSWISIFDIGIGNGLRNKFTESIALGNIKDAREYVSTGYVVVGAISIALILFFLVPWHILNWARVFNTTEDLRGELFWLIGISFILTSVQFCLKLICTILLANHEPAKSSIIASISNTTILVSILIFRKWLQGNLVGIGLVYTSVPIIVFLFTSLGLFSKSLYEVRPSIAYFNKDKVRSLFSLGIEFFIIQISVIIIFQTDALIIAHVLSPQDVTAYNIVFKYFSVISVFAGIILHPFWNAYTEAAAKGDKDWIRIAIKRQLKGLIVIVFLIVVLLVLAQYIIPIWLNTSVSISNILLVGMAGYTFVYIYNNIFTYLLNGLSKIRLQMVTSIIGALINIPLSIFLAQRLGSGGVIIASIISLSLFSLLGPMQAIRFLKSK
jgi:O-antigen/teichoic acid export membrane protein